MEHLPSNLELRTEKGQKMSLDRECKIYEQISSWDFVKKPNQKTSILSRV